ncbi:hypothetical protein [Adlercreutzia sp. ZJ473]|uniref:hypothetical protein n=1 Tax=Adlercreutzia sp. ZJ473 TaxID=2722822 RepID=UPI00155668A8|nr:hypothetical protein [Adlercreutzia sp. ZJ473]
MKSTREYDWLNDPFDEKKCAEELDRARSRGMRGAGCALAVIVAIAVVLVAAFVVIVGSIGSGASI